MTVTYEFPEDLLTAQHQLAEVRAEWARLVATLPYSVEPAQAWTRPEGYWRPSPGFPASEGWSQQAQERAAELWARQRELAVLVVGHGFWAQFEGGARTDARSALKHAEEVEAAGGDGGA